MLCAIAATTALRSHSLRSHDVRGLAATASVGLAGFSLAVIAVGNLLLPKRAVADREAVRYSLELISAGSAVNTVGCVLAAVAGRGRTAPSLASVMLLVGGSVLSALYARHLTALREPGRSQDGFAAGHSDQRPGDVAGLV